MFRYTCRPVGALVYGNSGFLYTLRSSGARELDASPSIDISLLWSENTPITPLGLWVGQDARPTGIGFTLNRSGFCYAQPVGRDSYLDMRMSILENRPTSGRPQVLAYRSIGGLPLQKFEIVVKLGRALSLHRFLRLLEFLFGKRSPFLQFLVSEVWFLPIALRNLYF